MRFQKLFVLFLGTSLLYGAAPTGRAVSVPATDVSQSARPSVGKINEAEINTMIADIETAVKNKNAAGILKYYAPFVSSRLTVQTGSASETLELDGLREHTAYLDTTFKAIRDVEVLSNDVDVTILASDEMAMIRRDRVVNVTAADGKRYIVESEAVARVAPVDGKLKVISIDEKIEVSQRPN